MPTKKVTPPSPLTLIGKRLAKARQEAGLTQVELAKRAGCRAEALSRFESGKRGLAASSIVTVLRVAAEAGASIEDYVLRGIGSPVHRRTPITLVQDPAFRGAVIELARRIVQEEGQDDSPPSEAGVPSNKRSKP